MGRGWARVSGWGILIWLVVGCGGPPADPLDLTFEPLPIAPAAQVPEVAFAGDSIVVRGTILTSTPCYELEAGVRDEEEGGDVVVLTVYARPTTDERCAPIVDRKGYHATIRRVPDDIAAARVVHDCASDWCSGTVIEASRPTSEPETDGTHDP